MIYLQIEQAIDNVPNSKSYGFVSAILGMKIEAKGLQGFVSIGSLCTIHIPHKAPLKAEVIALTEDKAILLPFGSIEGVSYGQRITLSRNQTVIHPSEAWLGRVLNCFAEPIDGKPSPAKGEIPYGLINKPPNAHKRVRVHKKMDMGIRSINTFLSCCEGQRMGIFAGSGVGKSVLMSMIAKFSSADVIVIGLIGERGREVKEFIEDYLGEDGLKRSVVVVATSDEPSLQRRQSAYTTMAIAEYFRDQGLHVLCLMDSVTRFALAQREIGLSIGEPPTTRGYTPTVFSLLPQLLERAGPGEQNQGCITALFSVLVEGSDMDEPIADAVRGILDGHIVLERKIAERGRFPAINILRSVSRTLMFCNTKEQTELIDRAKKYMSVYDDMEDMIRIGAYRKGSDPTVDNAIDLREDLETFLKQRADEKADLELGYSHLRSILEKVKG